MGTIARQHLGPQRRLDSESILLETTERNRATVSAGSDRDSRAVLGQFMTPNDVARFMASLVRWQGEHIRILEPGAGVGSLIAAAAIELSNRLNRPRKISVTAYELDPTLATRIPEVFGRCTELCQESGIIFEGTIIDGDFIAHAAELLNHNFFSGHEQRPRYDLCITNPPYRKIGTNSKHRQWLRDAGIETSNLYSGFIALATQLLAPDGEIIAITPRSFCNGSYFRPFREMLLRSVAFRRIHIFESRKKAFKDDDVLQENIIWHAVRGTRPSEVLITAGDAKLEEISSRHSISQEQLVWPGDRQRFIHIIQNAKAESTTDLMRKLPCTLHDLDVEVSTGRVVDFRAKKYLRAQPVPGSAPLIYPLHFNGGFVKWPVEGRKANSLILDDYIRDQIIPNEVYVLLKRFTSKEERRRIVAVVYDPGRLGSSTGEIPGVGFENHLNYIHRHGRGLPLDFAKGLALYFNSSAVDEFFRQFSGHTQVNAADLRMLKYPTAKGLFMLGKIANDGVPEQTEIDAMVAGVLNDLDARGES